MDFADTPVREYGLSPLLGPSPRVLVLGSFPSRMSLAEGLYYANPRNHFWPIMRRLLDLEGDAIPEWAEGLKARHIAVWDAIASRKFQPGSMDRDIRDEEWNDIPGFLRAHPTIRCICLNGGKARGSFQRAIQGAALPSSVKVHPLPSSSPANARYSLGEKIERWMILA
ncbi:MAG: DNA-deoxyinosine glycosylase [Methanolinea sp.]|jgi:TDG/mug DNA glycosylase family protein|nr:DNA-deoxyinosine glycosylase [Methanolinea sp.]